MRQTLAGMENVNRKEEKIFGRVTGWLPKGALQKASHSLSDHCGEDESVLEMCSNAAADPKQIFSFNHQIWRKTHAIFAIRLLLALDTFYESRFYDGNEFRAFTGRRHRSDSVDV